MELQSANGGDQRVAGVDIDLTKKRTTATPLHPMVRRVSTSWLCSVVRRVCRQDNIAVVEQVNATIIEHYIGFGKKLSEAIKYPK